MASFTKEMFEIYSPKLSVATIVDGFTLFLELMHFLYGYTLVQYICEFVFGENWAFKTFDSLEL
jgi:hypothetical protein